MSIILTEVQKLPLSVDFQWLHPLQDQIDEVQEQIDVTALAKDPLSKKSADYRILQKHLNAEIVRRGKLMIDHQAIAASHGYQLLAYPQVSEDGKRLRYVYVLKGESPL